MAVLLLIVATRRLGISLLGLIIGNKLIDHHAINTQFRKV